MFLESRQSFSDYQWSLIAFFSILFLYLVAFNTLPKSVFGRLMRELN
jgi:hypothetical protein